MHKYVASKRQRLLHLLVLILTPLALYVFGIKTVIHVVNEKQDDIVFWVCILLFILDGIFCFLALLWKFLDDPILGRFSFDKDGVTFYTPLRSITFLYEECAEIGITRWIGGGQIKAQYIYYVFLSKKVLTDEQRAYLFLGRSKKKRGKRHMPLYQSEYVLFQYRPDIFASFIECVPEQFKNGLLWKEKNLNLRPYERILHR